MNALQADQNEVPTLIFTSNEPIRYPFVDVNSHYVKFHRNQLYRQNSQIAILVADPTLPIQVDISSNSNNNNNGKQSLRKANAISKSFCNIQDHNRMQMNKKTVIKSSSKTAFRISSKSKIPLPQKNQERKTVTTKEVDIMGTKEKSVLPNVSSEKTNIEVVMKFPPKKNKHHNLMHPQENHYHHFANSWSVDHEIATIGSRLLEASKTIEFLKSDIETICSILGSDQLQVQTESVVFRAAHRWLRFQLLERVKWSDKVMSCVRFGLMKPRDIIKCYTRSRSIGLLDNADFCDYLFIGLVWSTACHFNLEHLVSELKPRKRNARNNSSNNFKEPEQLTNPFPDTVFSDVTLASYHSSMTSNSVKHE